MDETESQIQCCPICYEDKCLINVVCSHKYCILCISKLLKCAFCRMSYKRPFLEDIKKRGRLMYIQIEENKRRRICKPENKIMQRFDGIYYTPFIN